VFVEWGANDLFVHSAPEAEKNYKNDEGRSIQWYTEVLLRRLLKARIPNPIAVVYLEVGFSYGSFANYEHWQAKQTTSLGSASGWHVPVLQMYGIPGYSFIDWFVPLVLRDFASHNQTPVTMEQPFGFGAVLNDMCCHPQALVQRMYTITMAFNFCDDLDYYLREKTLPAKQIEQQRVQEADLTALSTGAKLPQPWHLTKQDEAMYVQRSFLSTFDFQMHPLKQEFIGANDTNLPGGNANATQRWHRFADNKEGDKYGIIALGYEAHLSVRVKVSPEGLVFVGYLGSYERIGRVGIWMDDSPTIKPDKQTMCTAPFADHTINALQLKATSSAFISAEFHWPKTCLATECFVHFCLARGGYPKFKLLSLETL
jgi:hypothetical protein